MQGGLGLGFSLVEHIRLILTIAQMTLIDFLCKQRFLGNSALISITESSLTHAFRCYALRELIRGLILVEGFILRLLACRFDRVAWVELEVRLHNKLDWANLQFAWRWGRFKSILHIIWSVNSSLVDWVVLCVNLSALSLKPRRPIEILIVGSRLRRGLICNNGAREITMVYRLLRDV